MRACYLCYDMLLKLPYLVVFGELCLFQMGAVHVEQLLSVAQTKVNALRAQHKQSPAYNQDVFQKFICKAFV